MMMLLACSAFFSGSETSFFNLTRRQVSLLSQSKHKLQVLVSRLLNKPKQLLSCLLFGNMTVNVLFYAISSVLIVRVGRQVGAGAAAVTAFMSFAVLVLFGEILPKSLAYANSRSVSVAAALPLVLCLQIFAPAVCVQSLYSRAYSSAVFGAVKTGQANKYRRIQIVD